MQTTLAKRMQDIKPSATLALSARAAELRAQGQPIINMGVGEPDFDTPQHIKDAAIEAINSGFTKYTPVDGIPELKDAIAAKFKQDNGLDYIRSQLIVSTGAKQALYNLFQAFLNDGDEAILLAPYWVSYPEMVKLAGATPVVVSAGIDQAFKITPAQLHEAITPKTRLVVLNSPSNPTGMAYSSDELKAIGAVLARHPQILIATDDIYERNLWSASPFANIVMACPDLYDRTIVFNGVSKTYAMTGWRIGYAAGPEAIIKGMKKIQSQSTSNPNAIAQKAAVAALTGDQSCVSEMTQAYKERHDRVYDALKQMDGIRCQPSDGTFYIFPEVSALMKKAGFTSDIDFAEHLLNNAHIAVVPGSAFGAPFHIRISYVLSMDTLDEAIERLAGICA